ncbi:MAG: SpaA isopeptide-forming pilin-related protein [Thermomicrobiales bacterium]
MLGQACDASDGNDGFTQIQFPAGVEPGNYDLTEVSTPDGVDSAPDQGVELSGGNASVTVFISGGAIEEPTEEPSAEATEVPTDEPTAEVDETFTLSLFLVDLDRNAVFGGCVQVDGVGDGCDDDFDSVISFPDVPNGTYQAVVTQAPDGYEPAEPVNVTIEGEDAGWYVYVEPAVVLEYGTLYVNAVDADGNLVPGACWQIRPRPGTDGVQVDACDGDDGSLDGTTIFANAIAGGYAIDQTVTPDGYEQAGRRNAEVPANGEDSMDIRTNAIPSELPTEVATEEPTTEPVEEPTATTEAPAGAFSLSLYAVDESGTPLVGGCYAIDGGTEELCDTDFDSVVTFQDLENGSYTVTTTTPPEGYGPNDPFQADINGEDLALYVTHPAASAETGTLYVNAVDGNGNLVPGACWQLRPRPDSTGELAEACDGDDGSLDGVTIFTNAVAGAYAIDQITTPDGYDVAGRRNVDVLAGGENSIDITQPSFEPTATEEPVITTAPVYVSVIDGDGNAVQGSCVSLVNGETFSACDNDANDGDGTDGVILFPEVPAGDYIASADSLPSGYAGADTAPVSVPEGDDQPIFVNLTAELAVGSLSIGTQDFAGNTVGGACYSIDGGAPVCDNGDGDADPSDGIVQVDGLAVGDVQVVQTDAPEDYDPNTEPQTTTIIANDIAYLFFFNAESIPPIGNLEILTQDEVGNPLGGACYTIGGEQVCDNDSGDDNPNDGELLITGLDAPADVDVSQSAAPIDYDLVEGAQTASIVPGDTTTITFFNSLTPPPTGRAYIVTRNADTGEDVGGACFTIEGPESLTICDNDANDTDEDPGQIRIASLLAGDYLVTETTAPDGYQLADPMPMTVPVDDVGRLTIDHTLSTGSLRILVASDAGEPLTDACVSLNDGDPICDNGDGDADGTAGVILIEGLFPSIYTVATTTAPDGFELAGVTSIEVFLEPRRNST